MSLSRRAFFFFAPLSVFCFEYEVRFIGLSDFDALSSLIDSSELVSLEHRPPPSINSLRYRIQGDIPHLIETLHAHAYYEASIDFRIGPEENGKVIVDLLISPGPQFSLSSYEIFHGDCKETGAIPPCPSFSLDALGLRLGKPALSVSIINAELSLLNRLASCGYPLAWIQKRKVEVDMKEKTVEAAACVDQGPLSKFGPTSYFGIEKINPELITRRTMWKEGEVYNADLIEETQKRLLQTELFSSVMITHAETLGEKGELPIQMRISEAKHKQISLGAYYATVDGPGGQLTWTHRNVRGLGEIVSIKIDGSQRFIGGNLTYKKPDFFLFDQTYRAYFDVSRENIYPYLSLMYRLANFIDRKINPKTFFSVGLKFDHLNVSESAANGTYWLAGLPIFCKYDGSNNPIDPTLGYTFAYSATPYQSMLHAKERFLKQRFTATGYIPLSPQKILVLALKLQLGSIAGTEAANVPLPKLFLGGSEDSLRGYKYKTVSPLKDRHPLGGRSAIFSSIEARLRLFDKIGIVPFADFGVVSRKQWPQFRDKWFKSVGIGARYFAFFGPLRFDVGFPLDRRKGIDSKFQFYASVGQAF